MGRNEIRLRRQKMSSGRIAQHRNYGELMARHERDVKMTRLFRLFTYFVIAAILIIIFFMVRFWERRHESVPQAKPSTTYIISNAADPQWKDFLGTQRQV